MLAVCAISSMLMIVLATLFTTGMWEVGRSSGRIEVVRRGRLAIDQMQRYLSTVIESSGLYSGGDAIRETIYTPEKIYDPNLATTHSTNPADGFIAYKIHFFTPIDLLGTGPLRTAREHQATPINNAYEITTIPGPNNEGQDLILRRLVTPTTANPLPIDMDAAVRPRFLGRRLGIPNSAAPGGYEKGLVVRKLREGALQIEIGLSSDLVTDDLNRSQLENHTPLRMVMRTIYQPPYFSLRI